MLGVAEPLNFPTPPVHVGFRCAWTACVKATSPTPPLHVGFRCAWRACAKARVRGFFQRLLQSLHRAATFPAACNCSSCSPSSLPGVRAGSSLVFLCLGFFLGWCFGFLVGFGLGVVWGVGFSACLLAVGCAHRLAGLYSLQVGEAQGFFSDEVFP